MNARFLLLTLMFGLVLGCGVKNAPSAQKAVHGAEGVIVVSANGNLISHLSCDADDVAKVEDLRSCTCQVRKEPVDELGKIYFRRHYPNPDRDYLKVPDVGALIASNFEGLGSKNVMAFDPLMLQVLQEIRTLSESAAGKRDADREQLTAASEARPAASAAQIAYLKRKLEKAEAEVSRLAGVLTSYDTFILRLKNNKFTYSNLDAHERAILEKVEYRLKASAVCNPSRGTPAGSGWNTGG